MRKTILKYTIGTGLGAELVRATVGSGALRIAGLAATFLLGVQLARGLGAEGYGTYALAASIIAIATVPTQFGLPQLLTREIAAAHAKLDWPRMKGVLRWADRAAAIATFIVVLFLVVGLFLAPENLRATTFAALAWAILLVPLVSFGSLRCAALLGLRKTVLSQLPEIFLRPALFSVLLFVATIVLSTRVTPAIAMALNVASAALAYFAAIIWLQGRIPSKTESSVDAADRRTLLKSAFPMALTEGMRVIQGNVTLLMLGYFDTTAEVGVFRVAFSTATLVAMPMSLLSVVTSPLFARLYAKGDRNRLERVGPLISLAMAAGIALLTLPFLVFGRSLLGLVFGREFAHSFAPLMTLCAGYILGAALGANATLLNMTGNERLVTRAFAFALLATVAAGVSLIPRYGAIGAAASSVIGILCWSVLLLWDTHRQLRLHTSIFSLKLRH